MEGSYDECQVWWSSPHPISAASGGFDPARYRNSTVVPILWRTTRLRQHWVCCVWDCRWRKWVAEGTSGPCSSHLSSCFTREWWPCTVPQFPATSYRAVEQPWEAELAPLHPPTAATPVGEVMCGNAAGRLQEPTTRTVWRLALGSMCYPIGKPAGAALPGTAVTWGKEAPEQPLCSCSAQREHVLSVNCISSWKDP